MTIDHERCSELLPVYLRSELDERAAEAVRAHLESCLQCRQEERALEALMRTEPPPLTELQRARLRRGLPVPRGRAPRRGNLAGLGVVALVLLVLGGVAGAGILLGTGSGSHNASSGAGGAAPEKLRNEPGRHPAVGGLQARPAPVYDPHVGLLTHRKLERIASSSPFTSYGGLRAAQAHSLASPALSRLEDRAPPRAGAQIAKCAASLLSQSPESTSVPVFAGSGRVGGERVLVMGFVRSAQGGSNRLDRYAFWAWRLGDCGSPAFYDSGPAGG